MVYHAIWLLTFFATVALPIRYLRSYFMFTMMVLLWVLASFRANGVDADYQNYLIYMQDALHYGSSPGGIVFDGLAQGLDYLGIPLGIIFSIYALSIPLKVKLFLKFDNYSSAIFLGYVGFFVYLHDFTQIRAGLAIAIGYWAVYLKYVSHNKKWLAYMLLGCVIHPSILVVLLFSVFDKYFTVKSMFIVLLLSITCALFDVIAPFVDQVVSFLNSPIITLYYHLGIDGQSIKPFGMFPVLNVIITFCVYYFVPRRNCEKITVVLIKFLLMSQICWFLFYPIPVLAGRLNQIFLFSVIFLIPILSRCLFKNQLVIPTLYSLAGLIAFNLVGNLMNEYSFNLW